MFFTLINVGYIFHSSQFSVSHLQSLANNNNYNNIENGKRTKLEAFSGFLWKTLASSVDYNNKRDDKICRLGIVVDGRSRLDNGKIMNVLSVPSGEKKCEVLKEKPLSWAANQVHDFLKGAVSKEHFLGLIDWVEAHRPEPALAKIHATRVREEGPAVVISSGQRFPVANILSLNFSYTPFSRSENVDMGQLYCIRNLKAQIMGKLLGVCPKKKKLTEKYYL